MKEKERIESIKLRKKGLAITEIAKKLGVSKASTSLWLRHLPSTKEMRKEFVKRTTHPHSIETRKKMSIDKKIYYKNNPKNKMPNEERLKKRVKEGMIKYHKRKKWAIKYLGGKCIECNSTKELNFDHINPDTKSYTITSMLSYSNEKIMKELKKCQLLCLDCHKNKNRVEGSYSKNNPVGEDSSSSKFTNDNIIEIRRMLIQDIPMTEIAKVFNVSSESIRLIKIGKTWKHIK